MKKYLAAILLGAVGWGAPVAYASDRPQFAPAVYTGSVESQFVLAGHGSKKRKKKHSSHRHSGSHHRDNHDRHDHGGSHHDDHSGHGHYDHHDCGHERSYRDFYIAVPGLGSFFYRR